MTSFCRHKFVSQMYYTVLNNQFNYNTNEKSKEFMLLNCYILPHNFPPMFRINLCKKFAVLFNKSLLCMHGIWGQPPSPTHSHWRYQSLQSDLIILLVYGIIFMIHLHVYLLHTYIRVVTTLALGSSFYG